VRILLDECVDRRLAKEITGHEVVTVPQKGWVGIKNGDLLALAQEQFDVFVTVDQNLSFQQNISQFNIAVVILQLRATVSMIFDRSDPSCKPSWKQLRKARFSG